MTYPGAYVVYQPRMRGRSRTGPVGSPAELPVTEPEPLAPKVVPGSRTGTEGVLLPVVLDPEPPVGKPLDELPELMDGLLLEPPPPKIPLKSGPSCPIKGITKLKILFKKLNTSLNTVSTLSKNPFTLSPKLGSGSSTSLTVETSAVG